MLLLEKTQAFCLLMPLLLQAQPQRMNEADEAALLKALMQEAELLKHLS